MPFVSEIENLKILYAEILEGFSPFNDNLIKHLNELENIEVLKYKIGRFAHYHKDLPSEEEELKFCIERDVWSAAKEEEILTYKYNISDNEKNLKNIIPQQQGPIKKIIDDIKLKLSVLMAEKHALLSKTADSFADRDSFNYMIYLSLYRDNKTRAFKSYEQFQEQVDNDELLTYGQGLENVLGKFKQSILAQIACMPFFLNTLSYSKDNVYNFLLKPVSELTQYQMGLLSLGIRNLNILSNTDNEPQELLPDVKIDEIVLFYDREYSILLGKQKSAKK